MKIGLEHQNRRFKNHFDLQFFISKKRSDQLAFVKLHPIMESFDHYKETNQIGQPTRILAN